MIKLVIKGFSLFLLLVFSSSLFSLGISLEPAAALMYVRDFDFLAPGKPLTIINVNDKPMVYRIKVDTEKYRLKGYFPLPDESWVKPVPDSLIIGAFDSAKIDIFINIPKSETNYNRAWTCDITVTQSKLEQEPFRGVAAMELGAKATWLIESPTSERLPDKGQDLLSIAPAHWIIQYGDSTINKAELEITIRNDDTEPHSYSFETYFPNLGDAITGHRLDIFPLTVTETGWILDASWVKPKKRGFLFFKKEPVIKLNPGEKASQIIKIDMPLSKELGNKNYEAIVLIKPDNQLQGSRFCRFIIMPGLEYEPKK